jgi:hypothetical protein
MTASIAEWRDVTPETFRREITSRYAPAVLRGVVRQWPAVQHGLRSDEALAAYLDTLDTGAPMDVLAIPASERGRIFYTPDLGGFNYAHDRASLKSVNERVLRNARFSSRPTVVAQSARIAESIPAFRPSHPLPLLDEAIEPRIWLGGAVVTPAHFDESSNVACVVAGRRRFTLFPPEQVANLYIGPIGHAPTGTPISLVDFAAPDEARFPRFREALAHSQVADLEPGDAIYIPPLWWHHVQSLARYNVLVNYWWKPPAVRDRSALDGLLHALLTVGALPAEQRAGWAAIYGHFIFGDRDAAAGHIPLERRGVLGEMTPEFQAQVIAFLRSKLG